MLKEIASARRLAHLLSSPIYVHPLIEGGRIRKGFCLLCVEDTEVSYGKRWETTVHVRLEEEEEAKEIIILQEWIEDDEGDLTSKAKEIPFWDLVDWKHKTYYGETYTLR